LEVPRGLLVGDVVEPGVVTLPPAEGIGVNMAVISVNMAVISVNMANISVNMASISVNMAIISVEMANIGVKTANISVKNAPCTPLYTPLFPPCIPPYTPLLYPPCTCEYTSPPSDSCRGDCRSTMSTMRRASILPRMDRIIEGTQVKRLPGG